MIYFIQDKRTNAIKIGYTAGDPKDRMAALQTGNATELVLLAGMEGDMGKEAELHRQFAHVRLVGEWFQPAPELIDFMLVNASRTAWAQGRDSGGGAAPWIERDGYWRSNLSADQTGPTLHIKCPLCGCGNNHIDRVRNVVGYDEAQSPPAVPGDSINWSGRGGGYAVEMWCEAGHAYQLCFGFHKGDAFLFVRQGAEEQKAIEAMYANA